MSNPAGKALTEEQITKTLQEIATAEKTIWVKAKCRCGKVTNTEVTITDDKTRLDAIKFAHDNGFGKPGNQKDDDAELDLDIDVRTLTPEARAVYRRWLLRAMPDLAETMAAAARKHNEELDAERASTPKLAMPPKRKR